MDVNCVGGIGSEQIETGRVAKLGELVGSWLMRVVGAPGFRFGPLGQGIREIGLEDEVRIQSHVVEEGRESGLLLCVEQRNTIHAVAGAHPHGGRQVEEGGVKVGGVVVDIEGVV